MSPREMRASLAIVGLGLALADRSPGWAAEDPHPPGTSAVKTLYQRNRSFRIPFSVAEADRARRREVQLWCSEDSGTSWTMAGRATPDLTSFVFRAPRDGEYWFTVRTLDAEGRLQPGDGEKVEPRIKVVVDTVPPSLALESGDRTDSQATVRWQVRDPHLDLKTLALETQAAGEARWRPVEIRHPSLVGDATWDTGTPHSLKVRVSVADKAGNRIESVLSLPRIPPVEVASAPGAPPDVPQPARRDPPPVGPPPGDPPPVEVMAKGPPIVTLPPAPAPLPAGSGPPGPEPIIAAPAPGEADPGEQPPPGFPPGLEADLPSREPVVANPSFPPVKVGMLESDQPTTPGGQPASDPEVGKASTPAPAQAPAPAPGPSLAGRPVRSVAAPRSTPPAAPPATGTDARRPLRVRGPRFALPYTVEEAGPEGPAAVELWITQNDGQLWRRFGEDRDHKPPFEVELNAEGRFGFWLVARDARGDGDRPPKSGDRPQLWVEVRFDPRRGKPNIR